MCTTMLHGGVFHRTSTQHKSRNKMKEKKLNGNFFELIKTVIMNIYGFIYGLRSLICGNFFYVM